MSSHVVKNGQRKQVQPYKCKDRVRQCLGGKRRNKQQIITDYIEGKQTRKQLAEKYGVSIRTIERDLEGMRYVHYHSNGYDLLRTQFWIDGH